MVQKCRFCIYLVPIGAKYCEKGKSAKTHTTKAPKKKQKQKQKLLSSRLHKRKHLSWRHLSWKMAWSTCSFAATLIHLMGAAWFAKREQQQGEQKQEEQEQQKQKQHATFCPSIPAYIRGRAAWRQYDCDMGMCTQSQVGTFKPSTYGSGEFE